MTDQQVQISPPSVLVSADADPQDIDVADRSVVDIDGVEHNGTASGQNWDRMNAASLPALAAARGVSAAKGRKPIRSRVRHGSPSCADYGCTRPGCMAAARRDRARRTRDLRAGRPARVPATDAAAHACQLQETGLSAADIAEISGIAVTLVRRLLRPAGERSAVIHRVTSEAILGIPLNSAFRRDRLLPGLVGADRATTSLQELAEQGWPTSFLAARLETTPHTLAAIRGRERRRLALALDRRIHHLAALPLASEPAEHGIAEHRSRRARTAALQRAPLVRPQAPEARQPEEVPDQLVPQR
ncbi:hypothetical protein OHA84_01240 [Streptomyces sp. NBC_00513]|uniref:hypothetical protein n=1 Tax=unclassified Streptomyces TaxID=2593676 RepID=UPI00225B8418|nr:hypothetical protein [Streptomyces sp. NBC_00424]MCX5079330.1 hypothetical protein [Streptomyces sp. NBC_00424]WUD39233.1 hypothetical protein OHA84_01240 [Streptomyces sp. NBC_00513]